MIDTCTVETPASIEFTTARFGGHAVAYCLDCDFRTVYWDCACDLEHHCIEEND